MHSETHLLEGIQFVARLLRGQRPEELERGEVKVIISTVALPGLAEADEAEAFARGIAGDH